MDSQTLCTVPLRGSSARSSTFALLPFDNAEGAGAPLRSRLTLHVSSSRPRCAPARLKGTEPCQ